MDADRRLLAPIARAVVVVTAGVLAALDAPTWCSAPLALAAAVVAAVPLARRRRMGAVDSGLVAVAGSVSVLVLLGLVLDRLPIGLTRLSWAVGAGVLGLGAVLWSTRPVPPCSPERTPLPTGTHNFGRVAARQAPWLVAAAGAAAVAIVISVHATDAANRPPTALSAVQRTTDGQVVVELTGAPVSGRYELVVEPAYRAPRRYGPFTVASGATLRVRIGVPPGLRTVVALRTAGTDLPLRSLVLDRDGPPAPPSTPPSAAPSH